MPAAAAGPALFVVSDTSKLRVYVNVPQNFVPAIKIGTKATISVPEYPDRTSPRPSRPRRSRSMSPPARRACSSRRQCRGRAAAGRLRQCAVDLPRPRKPLHIPASALIFDQRRPARRDRRRRRQGGAQEGHDRARPRPRDRDRLRPCARGPHHQSPPDGIADGDQVRIAGARRKARSRRPRRKSRM